MCHVIYILKRCNYADYYRYGISGICGTLHPGAKGSTMNRVKEINICIKVLKRSDRILANI